MKSSFRIGIFTFHDEFNYGSFLQAFALQEAIKNLGYNVKVIDHHISINDARIRGILVSRSVRVWVGFIFRTLLLSGCASFLVRLIKSRRLVVKFLNLTKYRFYDWKDAPKDLGLDLMVVGSDQLWSCQWESPEKYFLVGAPNICAITYGVSVGVTDIPRKYEDIYRDGFSRFSKISVRERTAIETMRSLGYIGPVKQVVDPTLLVDAVLWRKICSIDKKSHGHLVCYLMGVDFVDYIQDFISFARENHCAVEVYVNQSLWSRGVNPFLLLKNIKNRFACLLNNVRIRLAGDALDFVGSVVAADWVVSDSFHALMFSIALNKNIRIIRPSNPYRAQMFSRIEDAVSRYVKSGDIFSPDVGSAFVSVKNASVIFDIEAVKKDRKSSKVWLQAVLSENLY